MHGMPPSLPACLHPCLPACLRAYGPLLLVAQGLEVIEAHYLFGADYDNIDIVIHPQSIIHSMVETQVSVARNGRGRGVQGTYGQVMLVMINAFSHSSALVCLSYHCRV